MSSRRRPQVIYTQIQPDGFTLILAFHSSILPFFQLVLPFWVFYLWQECNVKYVGNGIHIQTVAGLEPSQGIATL